MTHPAGPDPRRAGRWAAGDSPGLAAGLTPSLLGVIVLLGVTFFPGAPAPTLAQSAAPAAPGAPSSTASQPSASSCRSVVSFDRDRLGEFPAAWRPRDDTARRVYRVLAEGGLRFVRATAEGSGAQMGLEFPWDLRTHPILAWRWRPRAFPEGSDERDAGKNDSALGVYAVFPAAMMTVRTVKYLWSREVPVATTSSASAGLTRMVVLRSGPPAADEWVTESVDVAADYQRLFGRGLEKPRGIAVLTDADQTRTRAEGDYADFRVCPSGVTP